jgi:gamma-glutamylcyclotransferase (GGCT)/AIG2-like uncharacterized protein YtfP
MPLIRYFAYGSNMLTARLQRRCPSARAFSIACVEAVELHFRKRSVDGSGKAMLAGSEVRGACAHGVIFEIDESELGALDRSEGRGRGYHREDRFQVMVGADARPVRVMAYIADPEAIEPKLVPYDWYLGLVLAGAREHALPLPYIEALAATRSMNDAVADRPSRQEALELLAGARTR